MDDSNRLAKEIPRLHDHELTKVRVIGCGGFGEVVLYEYRNNQSPVATVKRVVIKHLLRQVPERDLTLLEQEAAILWKITSPYVIPLEGIYNSKRGFSIAMEYAPNGSCFDFFRNLYERNLSKNVKAHLWPLKCRIIFQVIKGMECLHNQKPQKVLHLDLKAANVLLDAKLNAKICDFGLAQMQTFTALSKIRSSYPSKYHAADYEGGKCAGDGTITHIAPERWDLNCKPTVKSDMYSFGIFVWEILTNKVPYETANSNVIRIGVVENNQRPDSSLIPENAPVMLKSMMVTAYAQKPGDRPTFTELYETYVHEYTVIKPLVGESIRALQNLSQRTVTESWDYASIEISPSYLNDNFQNDSDVWNAEDSTFPCSPAQAKDAIGRSRKNETRSKWMSLKSVIRVSDDGESSGRSTESAFGRTTSSSTSSTGDQTSPKQVAGGIDGSSSSVHQFAGDALHDQHPPGRVTPSSEEPFLENSRKIPDDDEASFPFVELLSRGKKKESICCLMIFFPLLFLILFLGAAGVLAYFYIVSGHSFCFFTDNCHAQSNSTNSRQSFDPPAAFLCSDLSQLKDIPHSLIACPDAQVNSTVVCMFSCERGYRFIGQRYLSCFNGIISYKNATCEEIRCQKLGSIPDGRKVCSDPDRSTMGSICSFSCEESLVLTGSQLITCTENGEWSAGLPTCKPEAKRHCPEPSQISNGNIVCNDSRFSENTRCNLSCESGYELKGPSSFACLKSGSWSSKGMECRLRIICPVETLPSVLHQQQCTNGSNEGSVCTYQCAGNRDTQERNIRTCLASGQWSNPFPTCTCRGCYGGNDCSTQLTWKDLYSQVVQIEDDKEPVAISYGDRKITCESDCDVWFINYDCSCRDSAFDEMIECNDYLTRKEACSHALSALVRKYVASGLYTSPCDVEIMPVAC